MKNSSFEGIPTFAPEHFARVRQVDTMKRKQFIKGINQIAQEGAIQIFQEFNTGMEEIIVGVVGVLQFEVLIYRLKNEYNVEVKLDQLPFEYIRWIENPDEVDVAKIQGTSDMKRICDLKGNPLLLFINSWSVGMVEERNPKLKSGGIREKLRMGENENWRIRGCTGKRSIDILTPIKMRCWRTLPPSVPDRKHEGFLPGGKALRTPLRRGFGGSASIWARATVFPSITMTTM